MKYRRIILCLLLIAGVVAVNMHRICFAQEEAVEMEVSGRVTSVDLENSVIVIKKLVDEQNQVYEDVSLLVDTATAISKGEEVITLGDLKEGDEIVVKYTTNAEGQNVASSVSLQYVPAIAP